MLEAFGKHAISVLGDIPITKGAIAAVGHVHKDDPSVEQGDPHYPKSVGHYWNGYAAGVSSKGAYPRTLAQYVREAQGLVTDGRSLSPGVEKIASASLELAWLLGDIGHLKRSAQTHRAIVEALDGDLAALAAYRDFLKLFLIDKTTISKKKWTVHQEQLTIVAVALCKGKTDDKKAKRFLDWPQDDPSLTMEACSSFPKTGPNIFRVTHDSRTIDIQLGSIHSVKGQTHLATLLLSTYWHKHSAERLMPWLLGYKSNGGQAQERDRQRLLLTYVAMTPAQPFALPRRSAFGVRPQSDLQRKYFCVSWKRLVCRRNSWWSGATARVRPHASSVRQLHGKTIFLVNANSYSAMPEPITSKPGLFTS